MLDQVLQVTEPVRMGTAHPDPCPECGGRLYLGITAKGMGYICENLFAINKCLGNAGANPDGSPMGAPATSEVRLLRTLLHKLLDPLWMQYPPDAAKDKRREMYDFMARKMVEAKQIEDGEEFHIADLDAEQLKFALQIVQHDLKKEFV